jgi:tRNA(Ile)-lysidine synthase
VQLTVNWLLQRLSQLPDAPRCHLALSGGLDSCVLLHVLSELRSKLPYEINAIHIHHGLQHQADSWQAHCEELCKGYEMHLETVRVNLTLKGGDSLEAIARETRYKALAACMGEGDLLLTAQHQDDQAETLLLQLLRGSGPAGLAAMPPLAKFGLGWLARPLLDHSRKSLEHYAREHDLIWREDPSNRDQRFDRNFIRHQVMPMLRSRWPAAATTLSRAARFSGEQLLLVKEEAEEDLVKAQGETLDTLSIQVLKQLSSIRLRNLLRHWIGRVGAPLPNSKKLARIEREAVHGRIDSAPLIAWGGWEVRRYRDRVFLSSAQIIDLPTQPQTWTAGDELILPEGLGRLIAQQGERGVTAARWRQSRVEVRYRCGGERCQLPGQRNHRPLKKLFQEWGVPPWERKYIPLIYLDDELAVVPGHCICQPFLAQAGQDAIMVDWIKASTQCHSRQYQGEKTV